MGRTIYASEQIKNFLECELGDCEPLKIGLIVGQQNDSGKDHAFILVSTPSPDGGDSKTDDVDEQWTAQHAIQVTKMMVGGMKVIGVFVVCATDVMTRIQPKLRQAVFAVHKRMKRKQIVEMADRVTERIVLQISTAGQARSITCKSVDVADPNSSMKPADWKFQNAYWNVAVAQLHVDITIPVSATTGKPALKKYVNNGLVTFCNSIKQAIATVDNGIKPGRELFESRSSKPKTTKKEKTWNVTHFHLIELFTKKVCESYEVVRSACSASFHLLGTIQCRAYLNNKATVDDAIQAIKEDAIRSIQARCDLLVDDLIQDQEDVDSHMTTGFKRVTILPRRVYGPIPGTSKSACDYVFPDESAADCLERFSEILGIKLREDMLDFESEEFPDTESLEQGIDTNEASAVEDSVSKDKSGTNQSRRGTYIAAALSMSAAVIAALMSYLTLAND